MTFFLGFIMKKRKVILIIVLFFLCFSSFLKSQPKRINIQRLNLTKLPEIHCYFTITDESDKYYLGLSPDQLEITIDGVLQENIKLISAIDGGEYLAVALLFDRSGSMTSAFDLTKKAAIDFVQRMSIHDEIAVISFDDIVRVDAPFTTDKILIENSIYGISMGKNTALYDAVKEAISLFENIGTNRQAVVIFSDGMDTRSKSSGENVFKDAQTANIPLYFIGLGEKVDESNLKEFSEGTGGHFFRAATPEEILLLYQKIAEQLQNQYNLTFPSTFGEDEEWHTMNITFKEMSGDVFSIQRKYQATKGPGVSRDVVAGFERQNKTETFLISIGIGVFAGFFFGLLIVVILKLTRPDIPTFSLLIVGVILCTMLLGGILGVFAKILSTT